MEEEQKYEATEQALRSASTQIPTATPDTQSLMSKARIQVSGKDLMAFGFAHLMRTLLTLFAGVYRQVRDKPEKI